MIYKNQYGISLNFQKLLLQCAITPHTHIICLSTRCKVYNFMYFTYFTIIINIIMRKKGNDNMLLHIFDQGK